MRGCEEVVRLLLEKGAAVDMTDNGGWTALMFAGRKGNKEVVSMLQKAEAALMVTRLMETKGSPRIDTDAALSEKDNEVTRQLDMTDSYSRTTLMRAADDGNEAVVHLLLEKGAAVDASEEDGETALIFAASNGKEGALRLLLEKGATVDASNRFGQTALMAAADDGNEGAVCLLLEKGRQWM